MSMTFSVTLNNLRLLPVHVPQLSLHVDTHWHSLLCRSQLGSTKTFFSKQSGAREASEATNPSIYRKLIWFHHIKSSKKRRHILEWGRALKLGGYCKPGFPGVVICEGQEADVTDYLKRIKRLRWQHVQVRGEEVEQGSEDDQTVDSLRRFPLGILELPESGMSELAEKCRAANLEPLFLTAFKMSR